MIASLSSHESLGATGLGAGGLATRGRDQGGAADVRLLVPGDDGATTSSSRSPDPKFIDQLGADNLPYVQLAVGSVHRRADALVQQRRSAGCRAGASFRSRSSAIVGLLVVVLGAAADRRGLGHGRPSTRSARCSAFCSSASSGRWPTTSTTRARPSGCSASSAAAPAWAARSAP